MTRILGPIHTLWENMQFDTNATCPYCNRAIFPKMMQLVSDDASKNISAIMLCPHCEELYFECFTFSERIFKSIKTLPSPLPQLNIPKDIEADFPEFVKIYTQSATAEALGLSEICGMGYRKALESLVKQFASETFPDQSEVIANEQLMQTIKRFSSKEMTTLATAATWLGNDHAHLVTKHPEFDLDQLKIFINMLCQHIQSEKEYAKAISLISKTNKGA